MISTVDSRMLGGKTKREWERETIAILTRPRFSQNLGLVKMAADNEKEEDKIEKKEISKIPNEAYSIFDTYRYLSIFIDTYHCVIELPSLGHID
jgi:hypothetical protein